MSIDPVADATNWRDAEMLQSANPMPEDDYPDPTQSPNDNGVIR